MTKDEYWNKLCEKNPSFQKQTITISTKSLKSIIFQSFTKGKQLENKPPIPSSVNDMFGGIFKN